MRNQRSSNRHRAKSRPRPTSQSPTAALLATPAAPFRLKPDEVERALATGEQAELLQRYFGAERYVELQQLARAAAARSVRGGPRVLVLPGIMGSTLGSRRPLFFDDVIWIDPSSIAAGGLMGLALRPGTVKHRALGVVLVAYLKLKLSLKLAGYDADFHPYDWRQNLEGLGRELAARLTSESASEISLVGHSMGGLVARAALAQGVKRVKRLILLGTPNYGSFAATQALRATYSVIRKLALLDLHHSPEQLTEQVFNTFPGLYALLPASEKLAGFDLYDVKNWPAAGPRPRPTLLQAAKKTQQLLAPADSRFVLIAGIDQDTITDAKVENGQFVYEITRAGDGCVPLAFAQLPGVKTYFIAEAHGSLPNNGAVERAVADLLATGETQALPQDWSPSRAGVPRTLDEEAVRQMVPDAAERPRGAAVSDEEVRQLIAEVAAPEARGPDVQGAEERGYVHPFDQVIVGRRHQRRLDLRLALGSITEANSRAYVLGTFSDVTPGGAAQAVDARLDGAVAEFSQRRMFSSNVGEVFILPTGSHALRPDVVLFAGLGAFDQFTDEVLELVAENVVRTFVATGVEDFATVLIGAGSGRTPAAALRRLLGGFLRGLRDADKDHSFRRVTLCERDPDQYHAIKAELYRLASTELCADVELTFEEVTLPAPVDMPSPVHGLALRGEAPVYLIMRQEQSEYQASLLTAGGKATVVVGRKAVEAKALHKFLAQIESSQFTFSRLNTFGAELAKLVLPADVSKVLGNFPKHHLVVVHDAPSSRLPWETIRLGDWAPALGAGLSRRYLAENLSVAKWLEERRRDATLNLLLVVNPTGDLGGADAEGERIRELFGSHPGVNIVERREGQARKAVLREDFSSGRYDVIHYAGHAYFDPVHPARSGLLCAGKEVLSGADLAGLGQLPSLVFFNACEAARIRRWSAFPAKRFSLRQRMEQNVSLAEAFLRGGAANYVGTYWPVGDASAKTFADEFYHALMNGQSLGSALLTARQAVQKIQSVDWADYILYGSAEFVLKEKAR